MSTVPSPERCVELLMEAGCKRRVIVHCCTVEVVAAELASRIRSADADLVIAGALLHDIGRSVDHSTMHACIGARMVADLGLPVELVDIVRKHTGAGLDDEDVRILGLPPGDYMPATVEEKIVAHADNLVSDNRVVGHSHSVEKLRAKGADRGADRMEALHAEISSLYGADADTVVRKLGEYPRLELAERMRVLKRSHPAPVVRPEAVQADHLPADRPRHVLADALPALRARYRSEHAGFLRRVEPGLLDVEDLRRVGLQHAPDGLLPRHRVVPGDLPDEPHGPAGPAVEEAVGALAPGTEDEVPLADGTREDHLDRVEAAGVVLRHADHLLVLRPLRGQVEELACKQGGSVAQGQAPAGVAVEPHAFGPEFVFHARPSRLWLMNITNLIFLSC